MKGWGVFCVEVRIECRVTRRSHTQNTADVDIETITHCRTPQVAGESKSPATNSSNTTTFMHNAGAYNAYAQDVLMPAMDPEVLAEIQALDAAEDYENPRYMDLLMQRHYVDHCRSLPAAATRRGG